MARPLRIQGPGLTYHVTARGNGRMPIYHDDHDRRRFLELLEEIARTHDVSCYAFCLMSNHYHAVIATARPNLSSAIRSVNGQYAQWWNHRHGHVGHVFQARFNAQVIQDDRYLVTACAYDALNPVRAGLAATADGWPWSSYRGTAGLDSPPAFLRADVVWRFVAGNPGSGPVRFREFVERIWTRKEQLPRKPVVGDPEFIERFSEARRSAATEVPRLERTLPPRSLDVIFEASPTVTARREAVVSALAAGYSATEIGRYLGVHYATVGRMRRAAEGRGQVVHFVAMQDLTPSSPTPTSPPSAAGRARRNRRADLRRCSG